MKARLTFGNPESITMCQLAQEVIGLTKSSAIVVFKPLPEDDPLSRLPDIAKARDFLGWEPQVSLREGLLKTIAYFREKLEQMGSSAMIE